jgi:tight adherence protein C
MIFASAFLFFRALVFFLESYSAKKRLGVVQDKKVSDSLLLNWTEPLWRSLSPQLARFKLKRTRVFFERFLVQAGLIRDFGVNDLFAFEIVSFLLFTLAGAILPVSKSLFVSMLVCGAFGVAYPVLWLRGVIRSRVRRIICDLPNVVDIITLSVEAGLDFMASIGRVVQGSSSTPLIDELKRMIEEVKIGASRADGLKNLSHRLRIPSITSFTALLIQADRLGASVGPVLRAQSEKMRTDRFQRAERAGAMAAQKLLFPLVFFIIPSVFIVIFGPLVVQFVTNGFLVK